MKHLVIDCRMYGEKYGGIGRYVKEIVNHIIKDNFKLTLLCGLEAYEDLKGVQSIHLIKMNSSIFSIQEQFELFFKIPKSDIFWSPYMNVPFLPIRAKKRVVTLHDVFHLANPQYYSFFKKLAIWPYYFFSTKLSNTIFTVSYFSKKEIIRFFGKKIGNKTDVIYNGCDIDSENIKPIVLSKPYILFVGSIKPHKNLSNALLAFDILKKDNVNFIIVGKKNGFITGDKNIFELVKNINKKEERIIFTDNISDEILYSYYKGAKMLIMPSLYEGFGLPIIEAMKFNTPIVCSDIEIFHEIGNEKLFYFNPKSHNDIAKKIKFALEYDSICYNVKITQWKDTSNKIKYKFQQL